ncbi:MAG: GNAT family N-acetyltransferase [Polyangiaceae bacterium]|nr:GNAT family N-acetyltransferase [Polyangiaceae bacterium]
MLPRYRVSWIRQGERLVALEPTEDEVRACADELAAAYNEEHNRTMMANTVAATPAEVVTLYADMQRAGGRPFLLYRGDTLMGDADLRRVGEGRAEFAIMVGSRPLQGRGWGTRFGLMLHRLAFEELRLERVYATILPKNTASLRLFARLGYVRDDSGAARAFADYADDVAMSVSRHEFERAHGATLGEIAWTVR